MIGGEFCRLQCCKIVNLLTDLNDEKLADKIAEIIVDTYNAGYFEKQNEI